MAATTHSHNGQSGREAGFSLVELCVVLVVIAVILGIAVVTLLGSRERAADRAAQARARQALLTQKVHYTNEADYGTDAQLQELEPSVKFRPLDGAPAVLGEVYVRDDGDEAVMVSRSTTGTCFWVKETAYGTLFAKDDCETPESELSFSAQRW